MGEGAQEVSRLYAGYPDMAPVTDVFSRNLVEMLKLFSETCYTVSMLHPTAGTWLVAVPVGAHCMAAHNF